jgi:hypothetical protein
VSHEPQRWKTWAIGTLLLGLGGAMLVVAIGGDSLFYVRDTMTLPLELSGGVIALLGLAMCSGISSPSHVPSSVSLAGIAVVALVLVRPGPLTVDTGVGFDATGRRITTHVDIPPSALVGVDAPADVIDAHAVTLHAGQIRAAVEQSPGEFGKVAIRMIGQVDDDDGVPVLVRFFITCCAADALRFHTTLDRDGNLEPGTWVEVTGQWNGDVDDAGLTVASIHEIDMPDHPYLTIRDA